MLFGLGAAAYAESEDAASVEVGITQGTLVTSDGHEAAQATRARTVQIDAEQIDLSIDLGSVSAKYGVFFYDANGVYLGSSDWKTGGSF